MTNIGSGFDWAPVNSFDWYYFNLSINQPYDPNVPWWYASLFGPQGSGWNYLQGLGMFDATLMDNALIGQTPSTQHALMNEPFSVLQVTPSGVMPISTLQGGTTYTLQIVLADGQMGGIYNVVAYSGGSGNGMYGGGQYMSLQTSSNGQFTYTPIYNTSGPGGSEYGFFSISSTGSSDWAFQMFAVEPVPLSAGVLTLGVTNGYGQLQTSTAEVSMFTTSLGAGTGFYNIYGSGQVFLNGSPLNGAVVTETSVNVSEFAIEDPTLPVSTYAPGVAVGHFISDAAGGFNFWTDAFLAEVNGPLYTQVVTLQATYGNLTSNVLTVYIEPQSGSFYPEVSLNSAGTALVGSVTFNDMKYVNYVNISIGNQTGQFTNVSYPAAFTDSLTGANVSGVYNGVIPVDFTNLPSPGTPIQLNMVAEGYNDLSFSFSFFGFSFVFLSVQSPIVWSDPITIANPGTMPTASLASSQSPTVNGNVTLSYAGSWEASGATGTLTIGYGNTVSTLLSTGALTGGYVWNSANYADGFYTLTYTVATPTGLHSSSSVVLYVDNTASQLNAEIVKLQGELSSAQATISTLQSELSSDNATIATMQSQINSLNAQVSSLTSQLSAEMAKYNATAAALAAAKSQLNANNATIASLQSSLSADNTTIAAQSAQITSLKAQIATLQSELNAKKDFVPPAWYDVFGGAGALLLVVLGVVAGLVGVVIGRHRKTERSQKSPPMTNLFAVVVPQTKATTVHRTYRELRK
jgi:subtilase family serine protease